MRVKIGLAAVLLGLMIAVAPEVSAQRAGRGAATQAGRGRGTGGRAPAPFPGQNRPPGDPAVVARGKAVYGANCTGCHGADLRGGDLGGPNLLRSQVILSDRDGELILPIVQGSRQETGMPAIKISPDDVKAVATFIHSVASGIGNQGTPPSVGVPAVDVLIGDAAAGQAYFAAKCSSCHSATGDLKGLAARINDPKALQNAWVGGGGRGGRGRGAGAPDARAVTVRVTEPSGEKTEGRLIRMDDFFVTLSRADDTQRTFRRDGDIPKVEVHDPMKAHRDLLAVYTDKDMHDVTAYLVTLK